jgi:hypothetical protein
MGKKTESVASSQVGHVAIVDADDAPKFARDAEAMQVARGWRDTVQRVSTTFSDPLGQDITVGRQ